MLPSTGRHTPSCRAHRNLRLRDGNAHRFCGAFLAGAKHDRPAPRAPAKIAFRGSGAGLDPGHVYVGEAEMVANLVDQHMADDAVHPLPVAAGIIDDGDAVKKDPVGEADRVPYAFGRQPRTLIEPEQIERIADAHGLERFRIGEVGDAERHIVQALAELFRQAAHDCLGRDLEIFERTGLACASIQPPSPPEMMPDTPPSHELFQFLNRLAVFNIGRLQ